MIDLEKMAKEHEALFPKASLESQVWKMEEEIKEYDEACSLEQIIKEVSDIVIVCAGLYRWCPKTATALAVQYQREPEYWDDIEAEVNRKWQVNLNRKWEWNGKTYKHVGKDGNE